MACVIVNIGCYDANSVSDDADNNGDPDPNDDEAALPHADDDDVSILFSNNGVYLSSGAALIVFSKIEGDMLKYVSSPTMLRPSNLCVRNVRLLKGTCPNIIKGAREKKKI